LLRGDRPIGEAALVIGGRRISDGVVEIPVVRETISVDDEGRIQGVG
jgi:hypothetical protein